MSHIELVAFERERRRVLAAGFTQDEATAWLLVARAGAALFDLPELHPSDPNQVADAIHVLQRQLMMRPAYREYKERYKTES